MKTNINKSIVLMMTIFLTVSINAQNKMEYTSYFAADSIRANVLFDAIDSEQTLIFNFYSDSTMQINNNEYYFANISGDNYSLFYDDSHKVLLREETETGRLYRYDMEEDKEILLCDMSLEIGDTIQFCYTYYGMADFIVDEISYTDSGKKVIHLVMDNPYIRIVFTEGCFPSYNPFGFTEEYIPNVYFRDLLCEYFNNEEVYHSPYYDECIITILSIEEKDVYSTEVYPNPGNNILNIKISQQNVTIEIYDILGKLVYKQYVNEEVTKISTEGWMRGMYLWKVFNEDKEVGSGKWFKQ